MCECVYDDALSWLPPFKGMSARYIDYTVHAKIIGKERCLAIILMQIYLHPLQLVRENGGMFLTSGREVHILDMLWCDN